MVWSQPEIVIDEVKQEPEIRPRFQTTPLSESLGEAFHSRLA